MPSPSVALQPSRQNPRAEIVLAVLAVLSLALIPIHINTIYSGLPAHPLFLHVPVILIPVATIGALVLAARPRLFRRHGVWLAAVTVVALAATNLTMGAGSTLRDDLHLNGGAAGFGGASGPAALIARHAHAASILRLLLILFTAALIVALLAHRVRDGRVTGNRGLNAGLTRASTLGSLRMALAVLAVATAYFVFHTGDLGAKAVWQGRLGGGFGGRPGFTVPGGRSGATGSGGAGLPAPGSSTGSGGAAAP